MRLGAWIGLLAPVFAALVLATVAPAARAEDGYDLWLRYRPVETAAAGPYAAAATRLAPAGASPTLAAATRELQRGLGGC